MASYRPRKSYLRPSDSSLTGAADDAATALAELSDEVKNNQSKYQLTLEHQIDLFTGEHNLGLDDTKRYVNFEAKSPKPADIILRVMGMLASPPKCEYIAPQSSNASKDTGELVEKHVNAVYPWLARKYKNNFNNAALFWQLLAGRSYLQQSYLPNYWDKEEFKRGKDEGADDDGGDSRYNTRVDSYRGFMGPPVFVESIDPRMIYTIRTPMGPRAWVKQYRVQRYAAENAFRERGKEVVFRKHSGGDWQAYGPQELGASAGNMMPEAARGSVDNTVTYFEYVDDKYCYYVVGGNIIHEYKHDGGVGIFEATGLQTGFPEEDLSSLGILWAVRNAIPQYDFFRTLWAQRAYLDVFPQLAVQLPPGEHPIQDATGDGNMIWKIEPQTIVQVRGILTNVLANSGSGEDFRAAVEMLGADIDLATITQLARGMAGAQQPGYSINQLSQAMRSMWKPPIESRELQHSEMYGHYLWNLKNKVKRPTTVFGDDGKKDDRGHASGDYITLKPEDIPDHYQIYARLEPELPIDKQGNMAAWMAAGEKGWATEEEVARYGFDASNPRERMRQIRKEQVTRAFMPEAIKDALTLGRVKLTADVAKAQGSDRLNDMFSQNPKTAPGAAPPQTPGAGQGAGPTEGPPASGALPGQGPAAPGMPEVSGANPAMPTPGPRLGGGMSGP